ncbi:helix-turn-helix domain-containing protein [Microbacterium lacticum]|uniref:helix-turn-helix domain-containing protein n=1 Tax=Microbacterium lacticum TaxID=33885 RepID=UPI003A84963A
MSRRLGAAATAEIIDRYGEGETAKALAEEFGIARNSVLNILRDNSVVVRRQPPSSEQQIRLTREYESGATIAELVTRYGHSYGAIRRVLKDSEIQMRARGGSAKRR